MVDEYTLIMSLVDGDDGAFYFVVLKGGWEWLGCVR